MTIEVCAAFHKTQRSEHMSMLKRASSKLGSYFLCHAQIHADLSNPSTQSDRLRPSTPCATALII